jgi:hypothetical protein
VDAPELKLRSVVRCFQLAEHVRKRRSSSLCLLRQFAVPGLRRRRTLSGRSRKTYIADAAFWMIVRTTASGLRGEGRRSRTAMGQARPAI